MPELRPSSAGPLITWVAARVAAGDARATRPVTAAG